MFVCVCVCVWAAVSAGLSLAVPAFLTLYVIVTVLDELNKRNETMWPGPRLATCMPSFILIPLTVWPQYTNVTDR